MIIIIEAELDPSSSTLKYTLRLQGALPLSLGRVVYIHFAATYISDLLDDYHTAAFPNHFFHIGLPAEVSCSLGRPETAIPS